MSEFYLAQKFVGGGGGEQGRWDKPGQFHIFIISATQHV